jgi:hypothetical protein
MMMDEMRRTIKDGRPSWTRLNTRSSSKRPRLEPPATLIHSMNESFEATVTKVNDDSKIFTAYTSTMDDDAEAWYKMAHARIMKEMVVASEAE